MEHDSLAPLPAYLIAGRALDLASGESVAAERLWLVSQIDEHEAAAALLNRGVACHRQGRDSLARQLMRDVFQVAESRRELATCAAILMNLAILERHNGRWSIANECLVVAERIEREASRQRSADRIRDLQDAMAQGLSMLAADPSWN